MYRDVEAITVARVERLREEIEILRAQDTPPRLTELRSELRRNRRDIARARRALIWLRHPVLRLVPRSIVEIVCSAGIAYAGILSAGLGTLIVYTLVLPLLG